MGCQQKMESNEEQLQNLAFKSISTQHESISLSGEEANACHIAVDNEYGLLALAISNDLYLFSNTELVKMMRAGSFDSSKAICTISGSDEKIQAVCFTDACLIFNNKRSVYSVELATMIGCDSFVMQDDCSIFTSNTEIILLLVAKGNVTVIESDGKLHLIREKGTVKSHQLQNPSSIAAWNMEGDCLAVLDKAIHIFDKDLSLEKSIEIATVYNVIGISWLGNENFRIFAWNNDESCYYNLIMDLNGKIISFYKPFIANYEPKAIKTVVCEIPELISGKVESYSHLCLSGNTQNSEISISYLSNDFHVDSLKVAYIPNEEDQIILPDDAITGEPMLIADMQLDFCYDELFHANPDDTSQDAQTPLLWILTNSNNLLCYRMYKKDFICSKIWFQFPKLFEHQPIAKKESISPPAAQDESVALMGKFSLNIPKAPQPVFITETTVPETPESKAIIPGQANFSALPMSAAESIPLTPDEIAPTTSSLPSENAPSSASNKSIVSLEAQPSVAFMLDELKNELQALVDKSPSQSVPYLLGVAQFHFEKDLQNLFAKSNLLFRLLNQLSTNVHDIDNLYKFVCKVESSIKSLQLVQCEIKGRVEQLANERNVKLKSKKVFTFQDGDEESDKLEDLNSIFASISLEPEFLDEDLIKQMECTKIASLKKIANLVPVENGEGQTERPASGSIFNLATEKSDSTRSNASLAEDLNKKPEAHTPKPSFNLLQSVSSLAEGQPESSAGRASPSTFTFNAPPSASQPPSVSTSNVADTVAVPAPNPALYNSPAKPQQSFQAFSSGSQPISAASPFKGAGGAFGSAFADKPPVNLFGSSQKTDVKPGLTLVSEQSKTESSAATVNIGQPETKNAMFDLAASFGASMLQTNNAPPISNEPAKVENNQPATVVQPSFANTSPLFQQPVVSGATAPSHFGTSNAPAFNFGNNSTFGSATPIGANSAFGTASQVGGVSQPVGSAFGSTSQFGNSAFMNMPTPGSSLFPTSSTTLFGSSTSTATPFGSSAPAATPNPSFSASPFQSQNATGNANQPSSTNEQKSVSFTSFRF